MELINLEIDFNEFRQKDQSSIIELNDIPNIDLYMDQVTTFMETKLSGYKRNEKDKILTKTMINNYAKARLFPPPVKKKYTKNHVMILIIIYHLKNIVQYVLSLKIPRFRSKLQNILSVSYTHLAQRDQCQRHPYAGHYGDRCRPRRGCSHCQ